jgi:YgiT-type zinc finger domain-containing protein
MKKGAAPFHIDRDGVHVSLDEIPAWGCTQCGESYFDEKDVDVIQELVKAVEEQTHKFQKRFGNTMHVRCHRIKDGFDSRRHRSADGDNRRVWSVWGSRGDYQGSFFLMFDA